jgi:cytochrome c oxidase subunit III
MAAPLLLVVAIMFVAVAWLFRQTVNVQPWQEVGAGPADGAAGGASFRVPAATVGLLVFLAVATSLFALSVAAYFMRMMQGDWSGFVFPQVLWANTAVLLVSDLAMQSARKAARRGDSSAVRRALAFCGGCTVLFLAGQVYAWQQLNTQGFFGGSAAYSPSNSFFYLFTALHAVHVLGGMFVLARTTGRVWHSPDAGRIRLNVELCTTYWHYLLGVWLVLVALLVPAVSELCRVRLFS